MKEINLSQGMVALVDDEDYNFLNQFSWYASKRKNTYYAARYLRKYESSKVDKKTHIYMHAFIMNTPLNMDTDHINKNGLDNRKENLRICTHRENNLNMRSQAVLIGAQKIGDKFMAKMYIDGKHIYLGTYNTPEESHEVYMKKLNEIINSES